MSEARKIPFKNPGWAGNTGEFDLTEAQVRGDEYVGHRPKEGSHPSGASTYPYMLAEKDPEAPLFEGPYEKRYEKIRSRYPDARSALLPCLGMAQEIRGHLSAETMDQVAGLLQLSPAYVRGVATFYTMLNRKPVGQHLVQVCTNISCSLLGAEHLVQYIGRLLGIEPGETTPEGRFTLLIVECLGSCGTAPMMQVDDRYYENLTEEKVKDILQGFMQD